MSIEEFLGKVCKIVLPIPEEKYLGSPESGIAICTLSSIDLMKKLVNRGTLEDVAVIGRLLSENKGIDSLITNSIICGIQTILLCGKEVSGHKTGHSLLMLHKNGVDNHGNILDSVSPNPNLTVSKEKIDQFRKRVVLVNKIGNENIHEIIAEISSLRN